MVFIPAGTAHGIKNSEDGPMRVLVAEQLPGTYLQRPVVKSDSDRSSNRAAKLAKLVWRKNWIP